jgi:hypothetical protein
MNFLRLVLADKKNFVVSPKSFVRFWPVLVLLGFVLFPLEWLGQLWPSFGQVLDGIFPTSDSHFSGHFSMFLVFGLLLLKTFPTLRFRAWLYLDLLLVAGIGEEIFQAIWRQDPVLVDTCGDLLTDLVGALVALLMVKMWYWFRERNHQQA